jgi:hypothetical protein
LFFFSGRKRKKTQIYFSEFSDGTPAVFTGLEHAATSTTAAHKPPKSSHTKWLNDERYSLSSSSFFLSFFLFSLRIESLTRHIYYSISAVKGDGALATTKLVVHQQRGGAPGASYVCVGRQVAKETSGGYMRWCTGAVSYAREFDFLYIKRGKLHGEQEVH